jgi:hypothetical protein
MRVRQVKTEKLAVQAVAVLVMVLAQQAVQVIHLLHHHRKVIMAVMAFKQPRYTQQAVVAVLAL